jgi:AbrB family looped-hinge helix DNA binding protein
MAIITSKGQLTILAAIRKRLGVKAGEKVTFVVEPEGTVRLSAPRHPNEASVRGAAGSLEGTLSWEEMHDIAHEDRLKAKRPHR